MEIEKSRNGFYTLTFFNRNNLDEKEILKEFNTVGHVCKIIQNFNRVFVRYKEKEEAERALSKYGKIYGVYMAKNKNSDIYHPEGKNYCNQNHNHSHNCYSNSNSNSNPNSNSNHSLSHNLNHNLSHNINHNHNQSHNQNQKLYSNSTPSSLMRLEHSSLSQSWEKLESTNKIFHLILCNLPKNYTIKDINSLVEEAKPVSINHLDETRVFHLRFCHIILESAESLSYLIDKLNGFVLCGEKIVAVEARDLLGWKENIV